MQCLATLRFGDAVLLMRRQRNLNQAELGARTGNTAGAISRVESGQSILDAEAATRLAVALHATNEERRWLIALAAHARLERCISREQAHWPGASEVLKALTNELTTINTDERSTAPS